jgi:2-(1,2-epoxy-1,2-dihydrophenyl)acetyl-CoA isomerase
MRIDHWWEAHTPGLGVRREGAVLRLRLEQPEKRNALSLPVQQRLIECLEQAGQDEELRVILLSGEGEHFCAGADWLARNAPGERPRAGSLQRRLPSEAHRLIPTLCAVQTPVVCAVRGIAAGIGCHLALAADFALASRSARFWEPFAQRGFTPDSGGSWLLPRRVGMARAKEMLLLGREVSGEQAAEWGLIHRAVDDDALEREAEALVQELASGPTVALGLAKWLLHSGQGLDLERALTNEAFGLELSSRSRDFQEGLAAFREKRPPRFEGR